MEKIDEILDFWFGDIDDNAPLSMDSERVKLWFESDKKIDEDIKKRFKNDLIEAQKGNYISWGQTIHGRLALIILLDQIPRHIYRDSEQAFDNDIEALKYALRCIKDLSDRKLSRLERAFVYMPFMHSENLEAQSLSVKYYAQLVDEADDNEDPKLDFFKKILESAKDHYEMIERFSRLPYKNTVLKRKSTSDERLFMDSRKLVVK